MLSLKPSSTKSLRRAVKVWSARFTHTVAIRCVEDPSINLHVPWFMFNLENSFILGDWSSMVRGYVPKARRIPGSVFQSVSRISLCSYRAIHRYHTAIVCYAVPFETFMLKADAVITSSESVLPTRWWLYRTTKNELTQFEFTHRSRLWITADTLGCKLHHPECFSLWPMANHSIQQKAQCIDRIRRPGFHLHDKLVGFPDEL